MKKRICLLLAVCMLLTLAACGTKQPDRTPAPAPEETAARQEEPATPAEDTASGQNAAENSGFSYIHDPRENPEAMKDIVENAAAVYGFSPDPASTRLGSYAEYDWTDPEIVATA